MPAGHESPSGAFKPQTGLRSKCRVFSAARARRFRCACSRAGIVLFWHQKRTRKVPAISTRWTHEKGATRPFQPQRGWAPYKKASRFAQTGCGTLRLLRALGGTRILQAAAPTAPPCFGRWPRSSPLQTRGCSPLVTPKLLGSIQKIQVASLKDFLCCADFKSLTRRNARATAYFHADANAPAGSQRRHNAVFAVTSPSREKANKPAP